MKYNKILVGAIYIAPRTEYKPEAVSHIIETMQCMQAKYENQLGQIITGDFNRTDISDILDSDGSLMQVCSVATRETSTLENVITNMATLFHPPTTRPPLKQDKDKKGKPSDHNIIIMAPKSNIQFQQKRKVRKVAVRALPDSKVADFMIEIGTHNWSELFECEDSNVKTASFHDTLIWILNKHMKEKHVSITSLDKKWFNPSLKLMYREMQQEYFKSGKSETWKKLKKVFRKSKRVAVRTFYSNFVSELKTTNPSMYYKMAKRIGAGGKASSGDINIECLEGLTDQEQVDAVADSFTAVSLEYEPVNVSLLPAYLPALPPPQVDVWTVMARIEKQKKTKTTLPIDLPESLRKKASVFLAEPLTDIINSSLKQGVYPETWKFEWVSPVPKLPKLTVLKDVRKIASTSDYSKIFEGFLKDWILEDIADNMNLSQYGGKKGVGTEHMIVNLVDRILKLLDGPESTAVIKTCADWNDAFSRVDPTEAIQKFILIGVRSSLIPVLIDYLTGRKMKVKMNGRESGIKDLIGGGPQGSLIGQLTYLVASDDCPQDVQTEDAYKYIDDLEVLELVYLAGILIDYNFSEHIASDVGLDEKFLPANRCRTQDINNSLTDWTKKNKMKLNESKSNYMVFTRSQKSFSTRFTLNGVKLDQVKETKLLGVWLSEDLTWEKNTREICKKAYSRMPILTKLKYVGSSTNDLIEIYCLVIRSTTEYCSTAFHHSLTQHEENKIESIQKTSLKVILGEQYTSYEDALALVGLEKLSSRRLKRCLTYGLKSVKHNTNSRLFPINEQKEHDLRNPELYKVNFARTEAYRKSAIPSIQRMLNQHQVDTSETEARREGPNQEGAHGRG